MAIRSGLAATAAVLALALGGCGGDSGQATSAATSVATTPPAAESTTPAPRPTTTAKPSSEPKRKSTTPAQPSAPEPSPSPELTTNAPVGPALICLRAAGLRNPEKRGNGIWSGIKPGGRPVFVDGPYESPAEARTSASSLDGVTADAVAGGIYVASSGLRSKLRGTVSEVAACLKRRSR